MTDLTLIFTDLDGSLLDHHSYGFSAAEPLLSRLEQNNIPVIPATSKTYAELIPLRDSLDNHHPFIVENGAGIYIPQDYFPEQLDQPIIDGYYLKKLSQPRSTWQSILQHLKRSFPNEFITFAELGTHGISTSTGLSLEGAQQANLRSFSEPVLWKSTEQRKRAFIASLQEAGANVLQGGRFLHVSGHCDKGQALQWLTQCYTNNTSQTTITTIAAGDGENDIAMLEAAQQAIIIRSPVNAAPRVRNPYQYLTKACGPEGWVEGVMHCLSTSLFNSINSKEFQQTQG